MITWAEVNLDAVAYNVRAIKDYVGPKVEVIAVVKANAYGHGAVPIARTALENGATRLAVYRLMEGVELRRASITAPVLILGYTLPSEAEVVVRWNLTPTVNERAQAEAEAREAAATAAEAEARRAQAERASAELEAKVRRQRAMLERAQRRQDQLEAAALARRTRLVER